VNDRTQLKFSDTVKDSSDPRLEELIRIIRLWDLVYFLSIISRMMAEELIRVRRWIGTD